MQTPPGLIRVILVDDHPLIHQAVAHQLEGSPEFKLVAVGTQATDIEALVTQHTPQVAILDLDLPLGLFTAEQYSILPVLRRLQDQHPQTRVLILSGYLDPRLIEDMVDFGLQGYLLKSDNLSLHLADAIRTISQGGAYFSQAVLQQMLEAPPETEPAPILTPRQIEVLTTIVERPNLTYAEQAQRLKISEDTLKSHLRGIYNKLGASNLTAALLHAIQLGLLPISHLAPQPTFPRQPRAGPVDPTMGSTTHSL